MSINVVILTGRLTADPEIKYTKSGKAYAKFSIAVNRRYNRDETDFINVVAWDKKAELASQYMRKGTLIGITGALRVRGYETESGEKRKVTEVIVENLEFLESKKDPSMPSDSHASSGMPIDTSPSVDSKDDEDDFPF
jgi:single-strand DNA-binding protein